MLVDVVEFRLLGKEKSFLNSEGKRALSQMVQLSWLDSGQNNTVIGLCGTDVCKQLAGIDHNVIDIRRVDIHFTLSRSKHNSKYWFTTCMIDNIYAHSITSQ